MIGRSDKNGPQGSGVNEDVSFTPVSYTHLDVYKRQGSSMTWAVFRKGCESCISRSPGWMTPPVSADGTMAVSYTHLSIVMHIHDEVVIEADRRMSLQAVCDQMGRTPPWAKGLRLRADGYETDFYKKD